MIFNRQFTERSIITLGICVFLILPVFAKEPLSVNKLKVPPVSPTIRAGYLDKTFDRDGKVITYVSENTYTAITSVKTQNKNGDFKILTRGGSDKGAYLMRYDKQGKIDPSFGESGLALLNLDFSTRAMAMEEDQKIIIGGLKDGKLFFTRWLADGEGMDKSFGQAGISTVTIEGIVEEKDNLDLKALTIEPDGKVIAAGYAYMKSPDNPFGGSAMVAVRLNPDGRMDESFANEGVAVISLDIEIKNDWHSDYANALKVQSDGKILLAGESGIFILNPFEETYVLAVVRLNPDGSLDQSFGQAGQVLVDLGDFENGELVEHIDTASDGKIIFAGSVYYSSNNDFFLARLNKNGQLDPVFAKGGVFISNEIDYLGGSQSGFNGVVGMAVLKNGKIVVGTQSYNVFRFLSEGTLDKHFGHDGLGDFPEFSNQRSTNQIADMFDLTIQPDGKIIGAGTAFLNDGYDGQPACMARWNN